jgi:hypothetical protein
VLDVEAHDLLLDVLRRPVPGSTSAAMRLRLQQAAPAEPALVEAADALLPTLDAMCDAATVLVDGHREP